MTKDVCALASTLAVTARVDRKGRCKVGNGNANDPIK